ncbi:Actin/actin-like protein [Terfezia boudieri ATCC MYA-4762]|uniref:Actin-like protein ARP6 n=1 Tax=Terfezia boudieri ATCC MYA-4762 TaxID=1051890 RepID=A0A3N4LQE6_9PEZI|nr:Actin/actin-like protein [Terfezia boudieri ATCC MYA-4762]
MPPALNQTLVVDNGAYTIKAGFAKQGAGPDSCSVIPNCIARGRDRKVFVGTELDSCKDFGGMGFRRPVERGYLVNWESEKEIWDRAFLDTASHLACDPRKTTLVLTEAPNAPSTLQTNCDQIIFEEYEFGAYYRCIGASLVAWNDLGQDAGKPPTAPAECAMVVDSGHSFTHVIPVIRGKVYHPAVRRVDVGGKFLTNYFKEMVSIRHYNMIDETHVMNEIKEAVCFVSTDFSADLEKCKRMKKGGNPIVMDYVLPDYNEGKAGYARAHAPRQGKLAMGPDEQHMTLGNERFTVPELLFTPSDVGMKQAGIPEVVMQSLEKVPEQFRDLLLANVVIVGGNINIPGFLERFEMELRILAPAETVVRVIKPDYPTKYTWQGGVNLALNQSALTARAITRAEYLEHGSSWVAKKFAGLPIPAGAGSSGAGGERSSASASHKKRRVSDV